MESHGRGAVNRRSRAGRLCGLGVGLVLAGCAMAAPPGAATPPAGEGSSFPTARFADIAEEPVSEEAAAAFQAILDEAIPDEASGTGGLTATLMTANGTWSGAAGTADGVRDMRPDDQMAIGSITKSVIAAQLMKMVEAGEVALDDPATEYLPADLDFDTNQATIRQLLGMRSGIPDYVDVLWSSLSTDRQHSWTPAEMLELVGADRSPAGSGPAYSSTNYLLLSLVIEQVRGRPVAAVLRDGVLSGDGLERVAYQPDEVPTEPMAMPGGGSTAAFNDGGGYLPSLAGATASGAAGGIASDSASLARWWSRFCGGEIVSEASLNEMTTFQDWYGLGLDGRVDAQDTPAVGHGGIHVGYASWAVCLVEDGNVVVVLTNRSVGPAQGDGDAGLSMRVADALAIAARSIGNE